MRNAFVAIVAISAMCAGCAADPQPAAADPEADAAASMAEPLPGMIVAERGGFIPEGVEYDTANRRLLTGSLSEGSIFQIHADGQLTTVVADAELVSSVGIEADEPRGRLLVANADVSVFQGDGTGQAKLGVYDLATGIVKLRLTAVSDPQHGGFATGSSPVSWGSLDELFVNLTVSMISLPDGVTCDTGGCR